MFYHKFFVLFSFLTWHQKTDQSDFDLFIYFFSHEETDILQSILLLLLHSWLQVWLLGSRPNVRELYFTTAIYHKSKIWCWNSLIVTVS